MKKPIYKMLYAQVLFAIACGVLLGHFYPETGAAMKPLGDGFIKLIKMIIAPIIFCTVVTGIAGMEDMKKVGRVGGKALLYFEVVSTIALAIGLLVVNILKPGVGMNADVSTLDTKALGNYTSAAKSQSTVDFLLNVIPTTVVDAFAKGEILQVLLFSVLMGFAFAASGEKGRPVVRFLEQFMQGLFIVVGFIMKLAPIGAFGAMAFTIGKYGIASLLPLAKLMGSFYLTCLLFIFIVLGLIARWAGFSIFKFIRYIREELLIVLRHLVERIGAAADDAQDGEARLLQAGGGPGDPDRLFVQPRRHVDLPDDGRDLRRAGHQHAADADAGAHDPRRAAAHVEGCVGRHRQRLHHAGRDAVGGADDPRRRARADSRHRPVHERSARADEPGGQRRRDGGRLEVGERTRPRAARTRDVGRRRGRARSRDGAAAAHRPRRAGRPRHPARLDLSVDTERRALIGAAALAAPLALAGCLGSRSTAGPITRIVDAAPCTPRPDTLVVLLPGARDVPADLVSEGFVKAVRERRLACDLWLADAHLGYYTERVILQRLESDVMGPAIAAGYRSIVMAGISIGGFGSLLYASTHPQQVQGVVALAPWLGPNDLVDEIATAGGLDRWLAAGGDRRAGGDAPARALWRWLHDAAPTSNVHLGYGASDRLAEGHRLLAAALPPSNVRVVPGGHDFAPWRALWAQMLDGPAFAQVARNC